MRRLPPQRRAREPSDLSANVVTLTSPDGRTFHNHDVSRPHETRAIRDFVAFVVHPNPQQISQLTEWRKAPVRPPRQSCGTRGPASTSRPTTPPDSPAVR